MEKEIKNLIEKVKDCTARVYKELGAGWGEEIYQKAIEVALIEKGISMKHKERCQSL